VSSCRRRTSLSRRVVVSLSLLRSRRSGVVVGAVVAETAGRPTTEAARSSSGGTAFSAAGRSLDADDLPVTSKRPFELTFEDGSERLPPNDGRAFGPN
jgi:hypothetical protein